PTPMPTPAELAELGLQSIVVARAELLAARDVVHEARHLVERLSQEVALVRRHGLGAERRQVGHDLVDLAIALEGGAGPRRREVAPLDQLACGAFEDTARAAGPRPSPEDATNPDTRMLELRLEPAREGAREEHA